LHGYMNLLLPSISIRCLVIPLAIFNHSQHKPTKRATTSHHNNQLQSLRSISMPYQPFNMMTEQVIEEKRVFYGIGGAGNYRKHPRKHTPKKLWLADSERSGRPSEMMFPKTKSFSSSSQASSETDGRPRGLTRIISSIFRRNL